MRINSSQLWYKLLITTHSIEQRLDLERLRTRTSETLAAVAEAVGASKSALARWEIDGGQCRLGPFVRLMGHYGATASSYFARLESGPWEAAVTAPAIRPLLLALLRCGAWRDFFWERLLFERLQRFVEDGDQILFDPWGEDGAGGVSPEATLGSPTDWTGLRAQLFDGNANAQKSINLFPVVSVGSPAAELGLLTALAAASEFGFSSHVRVLDLRLAGRLLWVHHRHGVVLAHRAVRRLLADIAREFSPVPDRSLLIVGFDWAQRRGIDAGELWSEFVCPLLRRLDGGDGTVTRIFLLQPTDLFFSDEPQDARNTGFEVHYAEIEFRHFRHPDRPGGARVEDWLDAYFRWRLRGFETEAALLRVAADEFIPAQAELLKQPGARSRSVLEGIDDLDTALTHWLAGRLAQ